MKFNNTVRLVLTNFSNVWKLLLYYIICIAISTLMLYPVVSPIIAKLSEARVFEELQVLFNGIFSQPTNFVSSFYDILITIGQVLTVNANALLLNYIFTCVLLFLILPFMFGLADLAVGEVLYGYMSSQTTYSFTGSYFRNFGKSALYSLARLPFRLVLTGIFGLAFYGIVRLWAMGGILYTLLGVLVFLACLVLYSLMITIFACWMPAIAVNGTRVYKSMVKGFRAVFRNFFSTFSNALAIVLCALVVNFLFGVFTFTTALIITLPLTAYTVTVYGMVAYFSNQGMRFYVYPDMFVTPKKIKEQETVKKLKFYI